MQCAAHNLAMHHKVHDFMSLHGFSGCHTRRDVEALHQLAVLLLSPRIASIDTIYAVQAKTRSSAFLRRDAEGRASAFLTMFALTRCGETAFNEGRFNTVNVRPEWVSAPDADTRVGYVWGFGASSPAGRLATLRALVEVRKALFLNVALYARAASDAGRALMARFGYGPVPGDSDLFYAPAPLAAITP